MPGKPGRGYILLTDRDDVVTVLRPFSPGDRIGPFPGIGEVVVRAAIPTGHKVAIRPVKAGDPVHKYGEVIGRAKRDIVPGDHVHTHNIEGLRGRGDLSRAAARAGEGGA
jgi:altronate dehydratase